MSAEPTLIPESTLDQAAGLEKPLNAEEATVLVLRFLQRLGKSVITPRSATLNGDVFIVEVALKKATAIVHVNSRREIVEYSINPQAVEVKPFPVPPGHLLKVIMGAIAAICVFMAFTLFNIPLGAVLGFVSGSSDLLIVGGIILVPIIFLVWWRRRS